MLENEMTEGPVLYESHVVELVTRRANDRQLAKHSS